MRTLTGITPSGTLHIGNYFGAMRPAIELQAGGDAYYFIADYHSMTAITDAAERRQRGGAFNQVVQYLVGVGAGLSVFADDPARRQCLAEPVINFNFAALRN